MAAFTGAKILIKAIQAAGSTDVDAVRAAAAEMDEPPQSYETGFGVKFDDKMQNTRALPVAGQWQDGKMVTVFPPEAAPDSGQAGRSGPQVTDGQAAFLSPGDFGEPMSDFLNVLVADAARRNLQPRQHRIEPHLRVTASLTSPRPSS